jgi:hypothetical protein
MIKEKENYVCPECMVLHFEAVNIMAGVSGTKGDTEDGGDDELAKPGGYFEEITWENNVWEDRN